MFVTSDHAIAAARGSRPHLARGKSSRGRRLPESATRDIAPLAVVAWPATLCAATVGFASIATTVAQVDFSGLVTPYFAASFAITFVSVLLSVFWWVVTLARAGAENPLKKVRAELKFRLPYLFLPALVFPLFLLSYTAAKIAIPFLVGYGWDDFWGNVDRILFGNDAWQIAHSWLGDRPIPAWEWCYTGVWGLALMFSTALIPLNAKPRTTAVFYTAMLGTWLIGGVFFAYAFSAAGPVFAQLSDPALVARYAPLRQALARSLAPNGGIAFTQKYLEAAVNAHSALKGAGISAMPSMHVGAASIYVLASRRTKWLVPSIALWIIIFVGSAYYGYHYWIDGIVASGVATVCWLGAERLYPPPRAGASA